MKYSELQPGDILIWVSFNLSPQILWVVKSQKGQLDWLIGYHLDGKIEDFYYDFDTRVNNRACILRDGIIIQLPSDKEVGDVVLHSLGAVNAL